MSTITQLTLAGSEDYPGDFQASDSEKSASKTYTRAEAMELLEIASRSTLTKYCSYLKIARGFRFFTEAEFQQLSDLNAFRKRGGHFKDYLNYQARKNCA